MERDTTPVPVPQVVLDKLQILRLIGTYNMFDTPAVVAQARDLGFDETADWIEANKTDYATGILFGFEAEESRWDEVINRGIDPNEPPSDRESMWDTPGSRGRARATEGQENDDEC